MINKEINKNEFRKYAVGDRRVSGLAFDGYVERVENMTRAVIEERPTNFREIDVFSRLIMDRIIFMGLPVDDNISNIITAQLLFLQSTDTKKDIHMYINSPGGSVYAGLGIYDTMQYVNPDVATICTGLAASMAASFTGGRCSRQTIFPSTCEDHDSSADERHAGTCCGYGDLPQANPFGEKGPL